MLSLEGDFKLSNVKGFSCGLCVCVCVLKDGWRVRDAGPPFAHQKKQFKMCLEAVLIYAGLFITQRPTLKKFLNQLRFCTQTFFKNEA